MNRLIIEETSVYELDEECVREKERERKTVRKAWKRKRFLSPVKITFIDSWKKCS